MTHSARSLVELLDWKRHVFSLYAAVRSSTGGRSAWERWRAGRDELFARHPQSPLTPAGRDSFTALPYFEYDPAMRVRAEIEDADTETYEIATSGDGTYSFTRFATAAFTLGDDPQRLELYWLEGYGGGLFLPFRDATSGSDTYGAGRYLLDTVKGADLGMEEGKLVLDFNFSYNPSCSYDPRWVCPLAPPPNRLTIPIRAGERAL